MRQQSSLERNKRWSNTFRLPCNPLRTSSRKLVGIFKHLAHLQFRFKMKIVMSTKRKLGITLRMLTIHQWSLCSLRLKSCAPRRSSCVTAPISRFNAFAVSKRRRPISSYSNPTQSTSSKRLLWRLRWRSHLAKQSMAGKSSWWSWRDLMIKQARHWAKLSSTLPTTPSVSNGASFLSSSQRVSSLTDSSTSMLQPAHLSALAGVTRYGRLRLRAQQLPTLQTRLLPIPRSSNRLETPPHSTLATVDSSKLNSSTKVASNPRQTIGNQGRSKLNPDRLIGNSARKTNSLSYSRASNETSRVKSATFNKNKANRVLSTKS